MKSPCSMGTREIKKVKRRSCSLEREMINMPRVFTATRSEINGFQACMTQSRNRRYLDVLAPVKTAYY